MGRGSIPDDTVRRIQNAVDIVDVVSQHVSLRKRGHQFTGLCPFHQEKTPSFAVSPSKQLFHCFGCGAGGDVFAFLMKVESLGFPEALRILAERTGISLPSPAKAPEDSHEPGDKEFLLKIHQQSMDYFHSLLLSHPAAQRARNYLEERGIKIETQQTFKLGYALSDWNGLLHHLQRLGWAADQIERAGLAVLRGDGKSHYDRFRDRLIFPIRNLQGKVVAFGGRIIPSLQPPAAGSPGVSAGEEHSLPKYLNSPETPIFTKGQHLYALDRARAAASREGSLVIVEGYLDALSAHQSGLEHVAATLGTALSADHLHLIRRITKTVILVFDPDLAGMRAALRTVELFLDSGVKARVVRLPQGEDPDSFIKKRGAEEFRKLLADSVGLLDFALGQIVVRAHHGSLEDKLRSVEEVIPVLARIPNHVERSHYIRWVADRIQVREDDLRQELVHHLKISRRDRRQEASHLPRNPQFPVHEEMLIKLLLQGQFMPGRLLGQIREEDFLEIKMGQLFSLILNTSGQMGANLPGILEATQNDELLHRLISSWTLEELACDDYERTVQDCIHVIQTRRLHRDLQVREEQIRKAEKEADPEAIRTLQREVLSLKRRLLLTQQGV